jgi:hypothetical protein
MGSPESKVEQPHPANYAEYVGGLEYSDDKMGGGDELPQVEIDMEMEELPMPLVPVTGKSSRLFEFLFVC